MKDFEYDNCNGWAAYESKYIEGEQPQNMHVVEANVHYDENNELKAAPNRSLKTLCGCRKLVPNGRSWTKATRDPVEMRTALAKLQNEGVEVCGICVSHFYADSLEEQQ